MRREKTAVGSPSQCRQTRPRAATFFLRIRRLGLADEHLATTQRVPRSNGLHRSLDADSIDRRIPTFVHCLAKTVEARLQHLRRLARILFERGGHNVLPCL